MEPRLIDSADGLEELREEWQRLAEEARSPYGQPAWALAWLRNAAPGGAVLRAVAVFDCGKLTGLAPFYTDRDDGSGTYEMLASQICAQVAPLARPGSEADVAGAVAEGLASAEPRPRVVILARQPSASTWPGLLARTWPGGATVRSHEADQAPGINLEGRTAEEFLPSLSSNTRAQIRRGQRALAENGAALVLSKPDEMESQIDTLARLHRQRMGSTPSEAMLPGVQEMLVDAGRALAADGGFRLWTVRSGDTAISSSLFVAAGGRVSFWLGAFDDEWSRPRPGMVVMNAAIEDAIERGDTYLDLGPGAQRYKLRLNDTVEDLVSFEIFPRGAGYARARARAAPAAVRRALARRLPDPVVEGYRGLRRR